MVSFVHDPPLLLSYPLCFSLCADYCCRGDIVRNVRLRIFDCYAALEVPIVGDPNLSETALPTPLDLHIAVTIEASPL